MPSRTANQLAAALGDELTQSEASFRVFLTAGGLAVLGLALLLFTIWWWRGTRPESPALGPLEVMSERRWHTASDSERRRLVDVHRPNGSFELAEHPAPVPIDLSVLAREMPSTFDDLREEDPHAPDAETPGDETPGDEAESASEVSSGADVDQPVAEALFELEPLPADPDPQPDVEARDLDETMFEAERPIVGSTNGDRPSEYEQLTIDEPVEAIIDRSGRSDELVIDPLLQRTASQD